MNADSEMQRIVNNTKIIVDAIDAYKLAYNKGGKIEILFWFWTMCAREISIPSIGQPSELVEKILHIIHSALEESSDLEEFIDEHLYIYEQRVDIYKDIDKWSERLRLLCQWARHNNYKDGVINGSIQLDLRNLGSAFESFDVEIRLQDFMKRAISDISENMTKYLISYLQTYYPNMTVNTTNTPLEKTPPTPPQKIISKPLKSFPSQAPPAAIAARERQKEEGSKKPPLSTGTRILLYIAVYFLWLTGFSILGVATGYTNAGLGLIPMLFIGLVPKWSTFLVLARIDSTRGHGSPELNENMQSAWMKIIWVTLLNISNILLQITLQGKDTSILLISIVISIAITYFIAKFCAKAILDS